MEIRLKVNPKDEMLPRKVNFSFNPVTESIKNVVDEMIRALTLDPSRANEIVSTIEEKVMKEIRKHPHMREAVRRMMKMNLKMKQHKKKETTKHQQQSNHDRHEHKDEYEQDRSQSLASAAKHGPSSIPIPVITSPASNNTNNLSVNVQQCPVESSVTPKKCVIVLEQFQASNVATTIAQAVSPSSLPIGGVKKTLCIPPIVTTLTQSSPLHIHHPSNTNTDKTLGDDNDDTFSINVNTIPIVPNDENKHPSTQMQSHMNPSTTSPSAHSLVTRTAAIVSTNIQIPVNTKVNANTDNTGQQHLPHHIV
ncbi:mucin-like protein [Reticulomyxa filosa]|uniref:Mucin-like protein n=1 Tax=Reticulomyxa filosa TaxID=46433 RepID=X6MQ20_RETFI|nr:mucin-like protein [Reticulomyxa filosa]|eukprot:ETO16103.1 mucin-like protein [Reticulomyxa filosa]